MLLLDYSLTVFFITKNAIKQEGYSLKINSFKSLKFTSSFPAKIRERNRLHRQKSLRITLIQGFKKNKSVCYSYGSSTSHDDTVVNGTDLSTSSNPEGSFKGLMDRCKGIIPFFLSPTTNKTTNSLS